LSHDTQVGICDGAEQGGRAHAGPGEDRAVPAVGVFEPCGQLLVDVAGLGFDKDLAAWRHQLGAAPQQPGGRAGRRCRYCRP
jgi:hypothetical protein